MGNRGSISVVYGDDVSVTLFRHWKGDRENMIELCQKTKEEYLKDRIAPPYTQIEEIIARMTKIAVQDDGYSSYLRINKEDGDNSDNGHFILEIIDDSDWILKTPEGEKIKI